MAERAYDVVVVGAGPAGEVVAGRVADHGLRTAIVEKELVGGECSYWGCIPSKTLLRPGDVLAAARRVPGAAAAVTGSVDAGAALARRNSMVSDYDDAGQEPWLAQHGVDLVRGFARLDGPRRVVVAPDRDGDPTEVLTAARAVVLATGTTSVIPAVDGLADAAPWDNRGATGATYVPRRLLVLGGGTVGVEMAQAFRRLGSAEVTVVDGGPRLLGREEPFAGDQVRRGLEADGIRVLLGTRVEAVVRAAVGGPVIATLTGGERLEVDEVVVGAGRRPATSYLGLETVGLEPGSAVDVDERLRATGVDGGWLYAVSDCNGIAGLTHIGKYQARIAADVIAGRDVADRASRDAVPRVVFTDPQVCAVGLTEGQARQRYGDAVRVVSVETGGVAGAYTRGEDVVGTCALVVDDRRRVVVGATFVGPDLQELLHSATVAVAAKVPLDDLWHAVPSFPTVSEVWLRLLESYGL